MEMVPPPYGGFEAFVRRLSRQPRYEDLASVVLDDVGRLGPTAGGIGEAARQIGRDAALHYLVVYRYGLKLDGVDFAVIAIVAVEPAQTRYLLDGWLCEGEADRRRVFAGEDALVERWLAWRADDAE